MVQELAACEQILRRDGWGHLTTDVQMDWAQIHGELNKFFSPLEIRKMVWEYETGN